MRAVTTATPVKALTPPRARAKAKPSFPFRANELDEIHEQATVVSLLKQNGYFFTAIPNGHVRSKRQSVQAFQEGVIAGMPDLLIFDTPPNLSYAKGVALEMKKTKSSSHDVRAEQRKQLKDFARRGWVSVVGYGSADALAQLHALGYFPNLHLTPSQITHPIRLSRMERLVAMQSPTTEFIRGTDFGEDL